MKDPEREVVEVEVPWAPGPIDDEWDSPGYHSFWGPTEQAINKRIGKLKEQGKELNPEDEEG